MNAILILTNGDHFEINQADIPRFTVIEELLDNDCTDRELPLIEKYITKKELDILINKKYEDLKENDNLLLSTFATANFLGNTEALNDLVENVRDYFINNEVELPDYFIGILDIVCKLYFDKIEKRLDLQHYDKLGNFDNFVTYITKTTLKISINECSKWAIYSSSWNRNFVSIYTNDEILKEDLQKIYSNLKKYGETYFKGLLVINGGRYNRSFNDISLHLREMITCMRIYNHRNEVEFSTYFPNLRLLIIGQGCDGPLRHYYPYLKTLISAEIYDDDISLNMIIENCPNLENLSVFNKDVQQLTVPNKLKRVEFICQDELFLGNMPYLEEAHFRCSLIALSSCQQLKYLEISELCDNVVSVENIVYTSGAYLNLQELVLYNVHRPMRDFTNCPKLEKVTCDEETTIIKR